MRVTNVLQFVFVSLKNSEFYLTSIFLEVKLRMSEITRSSFGVIYHKLTEVQIATYPSYRNVFRLLNYL